MKMRTMTMMVVPIRSFFSLMVLEIVLQLSYTLLPIQRSEVEPSGSLGADEVALKDTSAQ